MVFSSIPPIYLDPPNWQHHQHQHQQNQSHEDQNPPQHDHLLIPPPALPSPQVAGSSSGGGGGSSSAGSIRPGSMTDRARLAKIPQPEQALKCPRCDSANTKFCYFNNYSLTQPRHFCKTCRRYWTRGGALRNVPVGGGCRRNKRSSKSSSSSTANNNSSTSKSSATTATSSSSSQLLPISNTSNSSPADHLNCHMNPQLSPFMASLHQFNTDHHHYGTAAEHLGLNFNQQAVAGTNSTGSGDFHQMGLNINNMGSGGVEQQWRYQQMQQFPFMGNLEPSPLGLYHSFHQGIGVGGGGDKQQQAPGSSSSSSSLASQFASVKMEESNQQAAAAGLNLSRQFLSNIGHHQPQQQQQQQQQQHDNHQYWSGSSTNNNGNGAWTDLSAGGFNSSSSSHLL